MKIDKKFWFKQSGLTKQAYSYDNDQHAIKYAQQYGGDVIDSLTVSDEVGSLLNRDTELCSVLVNGSLHVQADSVTTLKNRYKVYVSGPEGFREYDTGHATLRDANNVAKTITKYFYQVIVLRSSILTTEEKTHDFN